MQGSKKVIYNTGIIYAKTIFTILISLYSTRLVINALGAKDFGLFNVIGGLISMLSFLNAAMTVSTQRYLSYNTGNGDLLKIKKIFANSVILHFFIAFLLVIFFETIGLYFLNYQLKVDLDRLYVANIVFHCVVISTFVLIISVPYDAVINAHENMTFLAIVGIVECLLKLFIAIYLLVTTEDKLLVYGVLTVLSAIFIRVLKQIYVKRNYIESHVNFTVEYNKTLLKELSSFAGWNLFGSFSHIARNQGLSVLLNLFYSTIVNAAFGIANQVAGQLNFFSSAMLTALNPQIMKSEGAKDRQQMLHLSMMACKIGFLLLAFIAIPCIAEMESIIKFWLKIVPEYTVPFCSIILIAVMINQLTVGLDSAIQATGHIRNYMIFAGCLKLLILPISYFLLTYKFNIYLVFVIYGALEGIGGIIRLFVLQREADLSLKKYMKEVLVPILPVTILIIVLNMLLISFWHINNRWLFSIPISITSFITFSYFTSFSHIERDLVKIQFKRIKNKLVGKVIIKLQ